MPSPWGVDGLPMDFLKQAILTAEVDGEPVMTNILAPPQVVALTKMFASSWGLPQGVV